MSGTYLDPIIIHDDELDLDSQELVPKGGATVTNLNPGASQDLSRDLPAPVLYWQPTHLPAYFRVHLDMTLTQQDLYLLTLFLWILFSE
jgi:hypothetical protein